MIVRRRNASLLLITQPDHAALSARIMEQWTADGLPQSPRRQEILLAVREHDNGWRDVDAAPIVDAASGRLLDFINAPDAVRQAVWPRGTGHLAATPYAAALVAQHALHIYSHYRERPAWSDFFAATEKERDRHLSGAAPLALEQLLRDYAFVRLGDLISLSFCTGGAIKNTDHAGYAVRLDGARVTVTPDPFGGREVPLEIAAYEMPDQHFSSADQALAAFRTARVVTLTGLACGAPI